MAKNERIIAQDLAEIKGSLQDHDSSRLVQLCEVLAKEIKRYPVKVDIANRLELVSSYSESSDKSDEEKIAEINDLIDILISHR